MNKRKKKKYERKFRQKVYYNARKCKIARFTSNFIQTKENVDLLHIIDSKRGNLKHPLKIACFTNIRPVSVSCLDSANKILEVEI